MKKLITRTIAEGQSTAIYYGMVCDNIFPQHNYTVKVNDIRKGELIATDIMNQEETEQRVIYLEPTIKVILKNKKGVKFIGLSICDEADRFSTQTGYEIALTKAKIKMLQYDLAELIK